MNKKTKILILLSPLLLASCGTSTNVQNMEVQPTLQLLAKAKNYTVQTTLQSGETQTIYFTKNSMLKVQGEEKNGFIESKKGVYSISEEDQQWIPSALLKNDNGEIISSLWNSTLFYSFKDFTLEDVSYQENTASIRGKADLLSYLQMLGLEVSSLSTVTSLVAEKNAKDDFLTFTLSYRNNTQIVSKVSQINQTKISSIDSFLKNGGTYFVASKEQDRINQLFSSFNYKRQCLDNDNETIIGHEWYNPDYFYGEWEDDYQKEHLGEVYELGVIGLNQKKYGNQTLNGSYYFYLGNTLDNLSIITTAPINENPDVTVVYNYPTYLSMLSNWQFFQENTEFENTIYTQNLELMNDFCNNFQIAETLIQYNCTLDSLEVSYSLTTEDKDCVVIFCLYYYYQGQLGAFMYPFVDFGEANFPVVDNFLKA